MNREFGALGFLSYLYYLLYELLSPFVEIFGLFATVLACLFGYLNVPLMIGFYLLYAFYGTALTVTAFFQRIYMQGSSLSLRDIGPALVLCFAEGILFHFFLTYIRTTAFIGYRKRKLQWGQIKREKQQMHS